MTRRRSQDRFLRSLCCLTLLGWAATAGAAVPVDALLEELEAVQRDHDTPVLSLVLVLPDRPPLVRVSRLGHGPASSDTPFRWGSISKTVTALALLEAARLSGVETDTPVPALLSEPAYVNPWAATRPVRLGHLLELSAGLPDLTRAEFADNQPRPLAEALSRGAGRRLLWPPGLQHSYSNVPPGISAAVVETLTGRAFDDAVAELVFEPLGMVGASFRPVPGLPGGFRADGRTKIPYWHMTFPAFGALNASPAAMAALLQALLHDGRVDGRPGLPASTVARTYRVQTTLAARAGLEIGYGAGLYGWVRDSHLFHGHGGDADGYRSRLGLLRAAGRGYLVGINVDDPKLLRVLQRRIETALSQDLPPPALPPAAPVPTAELRVLTGTYYPSATRFDIDRWQGGSARPAQVRLVDGELRFERGQRRERLVPLGNGRFRRQRDPAVSVVFAEQDGARYLLGELGNYAATAACPEFLPRCG